MQLEGVHHITAITADAQRNVDFYAGTLGLRMVKKTVNQDEPSVYHLFYADENGSPGADLTFFEFPGSAPGRAGAGMVHRIGWRVASEASLEFWAKRLDRQGFDSERVGEVLRFRDPEGLEHELGVDGSGDEPLLAEHAEIPAEHALRGFSGARAYSADPARSQDLLSGALGFEGSTDSWELRGTERGGTWHYDAPPPERGIQGAGTVHHIAWASRMDDLATWRERALEGGARPTELIDRFWFRSVYFREPSGVLFEIATMGPGFDADEPLESLGESLVLPPFLEDRREQIEAVLTPIVNPRERRGEG